MMWFKSLSTGLVISLLLGCTTQVVYKDTPLEGIADVLRACTAQPYGTLGSNNLTLLEGLVQANTSLSVCKGVAQNIIEVYGD